MDIRPLIQIAIDAPKYCRGCKFHEYKTCKLFDVYIRVDDRQPMFSPMRAKECIEAEVE